MIIGDLASILNKDATEYAKTLNLGEGVVEVPTDIVKKEIDTLISGLKLANKTAKLAGIKEGEGKKERLFKSEAEAKFKELGLSGEKYEDYFASIEEKIKTPDVNADVVKANKALKSKVLELEGSLSKITKETKDKEERAALFEKVRTKMKPIIDKYEFSTDKVKKTAINDFLNNSKFIISDEDVFLEIDGSPSAKFDETVTGHLSDWGKVKDNKTPNPKVPNKSSATYEKDLTSLNRQATLTTNPTEKQVIMDQIKAKIAEAV